MSDREISDRLSATVDALKEAHPGGGVFVVVIYGDGTTAWATNIIQGLIATSLEHVVSHIRGDCKLCPTPTNENSNS